MGGWEGLGSRPARDTQDQTPAAGLYEDAPVYAAERLSLRYAPHLWNTLWGASALGYIPIVTLLLDKGTPVDLRDNEGKTALIYAADFGKVDALCLLVSRGADAGSRDRHGCTAVHYVAPGVVAPALLNILGNSGANLDAWDANGYTRLMRAAFRGEYQMVEALLGAGAAPDATNQFGHTALLLAAFEARPRLTARLRKASCRDIGFGEAVVLGEAERAATLLTDIDLDAPVARGEGLLHHAARRGRFEMVRLLLLRGADPNLLNAKRETPLDAAAEENRGRILRLLLDHGADPEQAISEESETLLRLAGRTF